MGPNEIRWTGVASGVASFLTAWLANEHPLVQPGLLTGGERYLEAALMGAGLQVAEAQSTSSSQLCRSCYASATRILQELKVTTGQTPWLEVGAELRRYHQVLRHLRQGMAPDHDVVQRALAFFQRLYQRGDAARYVEYVAGVDEDDE